MKKRFFLLAICPFFLFSNDGKITSDIKAVTVFLNGAQITRTAICKLPKGSSEILLTGLSTQIDESSIQISGLQAVSILSMAYDINYMPHVLSPSTTDPLTQRLETIEQRIALIKNRISGLQEEEQVIYANRSLSTRTQGLDLQKIKEIGTYYRQRITSIKNEIVTANLEIRHLNDETRTIQQQLAELNNTPEKEQGELKITFDAPVASVLQLELSYQVADAGWIPNYDIKSAAMGAPLMLEYKAHVYQKTGNDWNNVKITLSTGNPTLNVLKPTLGPKYLNFGSGYRPMQPAVEKKRYVYNPSVKTVTGTILDESGAPLQGANVLVKGTTLGTHTDVDGHFSIDVKNGRELTVSYLGFHDKVQPIYSSVMNIRLDEDLSVLDEVMVTGYGLKKEKRALGLAVGSVSSENIGKTPPGIKIRGISSARAKSRNVVIPKPLYVVDGVPMPDFEEGDLDMDAIQSVEVLKGGGASALYGTRASDTVIVITTKKSKIENEVAHTKFIIKKAYSVASDGDITAIEINTYQLNANYEYFTAPVINENVYLTAAFKDWERYNLLPGEASIYFKGTYAGKTAIDPYTTKKEMIVSLGMDPNITVTRKQRKNFKSKNFTGNNRILDRIYDLEVKNNKEMAIQLKLVDRIPVSQNKDIKVDDIKTNSANYDSEKGLLDWKLSVQPQETYATSFSFQVKYPKYKRITI